MTDQLRAAWVDIDLDAIRNNVSVLRKTFAPAELCAVVKADGYGHGSVEVARAVIEAGATRLAVALVEEGERLREAGITAPILVLSEARPEAMDAVVANDLTPTLYSEPGLDALNHAVFDAQRDQYPVHVKVDTGMNRVGIRRDQAVGFLEMVRQRPGVHLEGLFTHFAVADDLASDFTKMQGERFIQILKAATDLGISPSLVHASNSAGGLYHPEFRFSFVRAGIALYGVPCAASLGLFDGLKPAMSVRSRVSYSKIVDAGEGISYGLRYTLTKPSRIVTIPVGYADGMPRALGANEGEVLINGRRYPIAGTVTMDQITVDCGTDDIKTGDEVVLIGRQTGLNGTVEEITAEEWAQKTGTIGYEITCRIGPRLPRRYHSIL